MIWLAFAFLSAALLGLYDVFKKISLRDNAVIPVLLINTSLCALFFLPYTLTHGANLHAHLLVILKSSIVLSSWICGYFAIKHLPLTIVGPINATRPVMTLCGALLIYGERLNLWQWAGVILAITSFYLLSRSSRKEGIRFSHNAWILLLVLAAILGAASGLFDKYLLSPHGAHLDRYFVQGWYNLYQSLMMGIVFVFLWYLPRKCTISAPQGTNTTSSLLARIRIYNNVSSLRTDSFKWRWSILGISLFLSAADLAYFYALSHPDAMISIVSMVRRSSVLVSFAFGAFLLHERSNLKAKSFDLLLVLLSMLCLAIGAQ